MLRSHRARHFWWIGTSNDDRRATQTMGLGSRSAQGVVSLLMSRASGPPAAGGDPRGVPRSRSAPGTHESVRAAEDVFEAVADALSRGLGPFGYHALLARALAKARLAHPSLADVGIRSTLEPYLEGLEDAAHVHGVGAMSAGLHAVLATLLDLLGRLIGEDLAITLVSEAIPEESVGDNGAQTTGPPDLIPPGDPGHPT